MYEDFGEEKEETMFILFALMWLTLMALTLAVAYEVVKRRIRNR